MSNFGNDECRLIRLRGSNVKARNAIYFYLMLKKLMDRNDFHNSSFVNRESLFHK